MKIQVSPEMTIAQIQKEFNAAFPYIKLVFFSKPHNAYKGSPAKYLIDNPDQQLGNLENQKKDGVLYLEPEMPTWQVERLFEEEFGLHVQVFRKSGSAWLETSVTDDLSLEQQNAKGRASEYHFVDESETPDYRDQD